MIILNHTTDVMLHRTVNFLCHCYIIILITLPSEGELCILMSAFVCLSVHSHISGVTHTC